MAPDGKSLRQFQCNDVLWATFQRMAEEQESDIDELIARRDDRLRAALRLPDRRQRDRVARAGDAAARARRQRAPAAVAPPPPPPPPRRRPARRFAQRDPRPAGVPCSSRRHAAAAPARRQRAGRAPTRHAGGQPRPLYLVFDNQKYRIDKDQFIIGRGAKSSDLPIKDGNISRKHAAVIRRNGTYFIKDLGSTNGIDFKGMRIDNKRIDEGDTFHLCDYELSFTYKR